jgi:acyl-CoA synthetase (NDP forming)
MKAAAGHTGAMAGNYELQKQILSKANIFITENFQEFSSVLNFISAYPHTKKIQQVAVISNAGFETVSSADSIGKLFYNLTKEEKKSLEKIFIRHGLAELVSATNPLDLTPMANQDAYLESTEVFANSKDVDAILFCAVPLTDKLETTDLTKINEIANGLKNISLKSSKPILVVVDSGVIYNKYRDAFKRVGLPTFNSIEESFLALKYKNLYLKAGMPVTSAPMTRR